MAFDILSPSAQVAQHLKTLILKGHWQRQLPGTPALSKETGIDRKTITAAIRLLEEQGLVASQGAGRPRKIVLSGKQRGAGLRVTILVYDERVRHEIYLHKLVTQLQMAGHTVAYSKRTLQDMGMKLEKVVRYVEANPADVWIPISASREILEWFAGQTFPAIALFGRRREVPIASVGPDKIEAVCELTRKLIAMGHRRVVLLSREERHYPTLGLQERRFMETMEASGIRAGDYNLPKWKSNAKGFKECLEGYFKMTPPSAMIIEESQFFVAALMELSRRDISVPEEISLFCTDDDLVFEMCHPHVSCIHWPTEPVIRHIVKWVQHVSRGKVTRKHVYTPATIIEGGTIGPMSRERLEEVGKPEAGR